MSRKCFVTGKLTKFGNTVSHSNRKVRRVFLPNLHNVSFLSDALNEKIRLRVSAHGIKIIEAKMGIDNYLLGAKNSELPKRLRELKSRIRSISLFSSGGGCCGSGACGQCDSGCGTSCAPCCDG